LEAGSPKPLVTTRWTPNEGPRPRHQIRAARKVDDAARKKTDHDPAKKWAHLTELARQRDVEAKGRAEVADLYE
jgi:hypothetical protein